MLTFTLINPSTLTHAQSQQTMFAVRDDFGAATQPETDLANLVKSSQTLLDPANLSFQEVATGLTAPVFITNAGDGSGLIFILERSGRIRILKNGSLLATPFLDIQGIVKSNNGEQGLLGLAFDPSYESNGMFYVMYTAPRTNDANGSVLTLRRYTVSSGNADIANAVSGTNILTIQHPTNSNHNGGTLAFGSDGYLYWSTGDGGGGGDPDINGQNLSSLLGKILRIDVNTGSPYSIPTSNPFYNNANPNIKKEIWAYGLRNPWRISFDRSTHDLYIADVGQSAREEIDFQPTSSNGGENYGWRIMEGSLCYNPSSGCDQAGKVLPVAEYDHSLGCSVTGGHVYRGSNFPSLSGYYFYGDYCTGRIFSTFNNLPTGWTTPVQLADTSYNISTFGEDESGELYLADLATGKIYKIFYDETEYVIIGNAGAAGVTLSYVDGSGKTVTSQTDGSYSITVPEGWSGEVTPSHTCYTFSPVNRSYSDVNGNLTGQNYTPTLNPSTNCTSIDVTIGTGFMGSYTMMPNTAQVMKYVIDGGPVVVSGNGSKIIASLDQWRRLGAGQPWTGIAQSMAVPTELITNKYVMPRYVGNDPTLYNAILLANVDTVSRDINVTIGETAINETFTLGPSESRYVYYLGVVGGPIVVSSDLGAKIIASLYELKRGAANTGYNGQSEMNGLPFSQLSDTYLIPIYFGDPVHTGLDARLFIAVP